MKQSPETETCPSIQPKMCTIAKGLLWLALISSVCTLAYSAEIIRQMNIGADSITIDQTTNTVEAIGNASFKYKELQLYAHKIWIDLTSEELKAAGAVKLLYDDKKVEGQSAHYSLKSKTGEFTDASTAMEKIYLRGKRIVLLPDKFLIYQGSFTTCNLIQPHYQLQAHEIQIIPKDKAIAKHISILFAGKDILTLPSFKLPFKKEERKPFSIMPYLGYSRLDGLFLKFAQEFEPYGYLDAIYSYQRGLRGLLKFEKGGTQESIGLAVSLKEDLPDELFTKLTLTRLPELIYQHNNIQLKGISALLNTYLSLGRFQEQPTNLQGMRKHAQLNLLFNLFKHRGQLINLSFILRGSWYDNGDFFRVIGSQLKFDKAINRNLKLGIIYTYSQPHGKTPFKFDDLDIAEELIADLAINLSENWRLNLRPCYDFNTNSFPDFGIRVAYKAHCLEYRIGWRKLRREVNLEVGLAGF